MIHDNFIKLKSIVTATNSELNMDVQLFRIEAVKSEFALSVPGRTDLIPKSCQSALKIFHMSRRIVSTWYVG